jgi:L-malate glycosyltransferase
MRALKILHITTHLGGGVGKALSSIVTHEQKFNPWHKHKILLLDKPEKDQFVNICRKGEVDVILKTQHFPLEREFADADVVVLHWWHHPIMALFLANFPAIPVRLVLWVHVNGCHYPCLPYGFVALPHRTFFTSPFSLENAYWTSQQQNDIKQRSAVVYGLGELEFSAENSYARSATKDFVIGYVGTMSSSKLHPQFVEYCAAVVKCLPDAHFVMVGDTTGSEDIMRKATEYHIQDSFVFTGYSTRIVDEMSGFDIFAYPLNPKHFGTTENVLLEAMAFGLPVVALNQNAEQHIINNNKTIGFLADSIDHYVECIVYLHDNPDERVRIGVNAREYVKRHFAFEKNVELMRVELDTVSRMPKKQFNFASVFGTEPYEWFLACLGEDYASFADSIDDRIHSNAEEMAIVTNKIKSCIPILREKNKSSIRHFSNMFPNDVHLRYWNKLLDEV